VSIEPDEEPAKNVLDLIGQKNVVFSTDYPHLDSKFPRAIDYFLEQPITQDEKRRFLWDNCARFYNLE
jgi:predicted TIM-barrel fold metal-dependent hydrolase